MFTIKGDYTEYKSKTFRLPVEILEVLENEAVEKNTSLNKVIIQCLEYAVANLEDTVTPSADHKLK